MFTIEEIKEMKPEERKEILSLHAGLAKKKAQVVEKVQRIPKNGFNKFHQYEYSTESDIKEGIRSLLSEAGLTLDIQLKNDIKVEVSTKQGKAWLHTVEMEFILTDNDTGYMDIKTSKGEATDNGDKGIYKAYAGCIKYYLMNNFLISTGETDNDPESGESDQVFNNNRGRGNNNRSNNNRGNNNQNRGGNANNRSGNNQNQQNQNQNQQKPGANRSGIEAKWRQLNNGSLDGLDNYIQKKQEEGKDLNWIDKVLLGRIQANQAQERKQAQGQQTKPEDFNKDIQEIQNKNANPTITDVSTGKAVDYNGKEITFE